MAFSFGFSGDDIDIDESENNNAVPDVLIPPGISNSLPEPAKARKHDMNEWVSSAHAYACSMIGSTLMNGSSQAFRHRSHLIGSQSMVLPLSLRAGRSSTSARS